MARVSRRSFVQQALVGSLGLGIGCAETASDRTVLDETNGGAPGSSGGAAPSGTGGTANSTADSGSGGSTGGSTGGAAGGPSVQKPGATDRVPLGQTGLQVPRLAMGTGTNGWEQASDQTRLGMDTLVAMLRHGFSRGLTFIDTADLYGAHPYVSQALQYINRTDVTLLTKIWFKEAPGMTPTTTARPEVQRFLQELGVSYLDIVLIHAVESASWPSELQRMREELSSLKAEGVIRAVGCSCHTHAALQVAADLDWVDVIFARINPGGLSMDTDATVNQTALALQRARTNGKGVVGMKIYGNGEWVDPAQRRQSLSYALSNGLVDAMTIGYLSTAQIDDTISNVQSVLDELG
jgi:predicted aldo/keto reductase-like oxidoreductase